MDYRLSDPYLDPFDPAQGQRPPEATGDFHSEKNIRLADSFWCYDPDSMMLGLDPKPELGPLPALKNGYITFGCLNYFAKVNVRVLDVWARVLMAVPTSRLLLATLEGAHRQMILDFLRQGGIDPTRIDFVVPCGRGEYLDRYHRLDVGLDTVPYNGHTTSLDAMWMGVPVVTLVGRTVVGRAGLSQLTNLKLTELVATTEDQYVRIAADLAGDLSRLAELRSGLRQRMLESPLTDARRFARNIEQAYRDMWRHWCESRRPKPKDP